MTLPAADLEAVSWMRFALASVASVGLLAFLAWVLKYLVARGVLKPHGPGKRLSVISAHPVDARRRLVLTRCDDKEYLLLVGGNNDILLDSSPAPSKDETSE
jgi:flagellar protein FliO/FliZ